MKTIKYKGKKIKISDEDAESVKQAKAQGSERVDVQNISKSGKFDIVWLNTYEVQD